MKSGFVLSDIGKRLRWSDIKNILLIPPEGGKLEEFLAPELFQQRKWITPQNIMLSHLYGLVESRYGGGNNSTLLERMLTIVFEGDNNKTDDNEKEQKRKQRELEQQKSRDKAAKMRDFVSRKG